MNKNIIDVITITYNNYDELKKTIKSLEGIEGINQVIINGGKCPETLNYLKTSNLSHISEPDKGISDAFNKGVLNSNNEYIAFLNSGDILIDQTYYPNALELFKASPDIDYIYSNITIDHSIHGKMLVEPKLADAFTKMPFPHPSLIVRRNVFNKIGLFDLNLKIAMDYDFAIRLVSGGFKGHFIPSESVVLMDGTGVSSNHGIKGQKERIYILKKYGQLSLKSKIYQYNLLYKLYGRKILNQIGLLKIYDKIKNSIISAKPE